MPLRFDRARKASSLIPGAASLAVAGALIVRDACPGLFSARTHDLLAAFSLAVIAFAYLVYQAARRAAGVEFAKSILVAAAFLFWAANQFWSNLREAALFNDIAVALFVLDIFLVMAGWPSASPESSFAEPGTGLQKEERP